ncbi:MAG: PEP-CTERM sorting domain-containing protein [Proteobacteria bacterium]|nr:PEP-CTERM sorting domain-containing protein [Pseudomonadota bacterium]
MNKFFMFLCIVIMFFGIVGCPSSNDPAPKVTTSSVVTTSQINDGVYPVPEPATLILIGSGLVGLAGFGRKKFKK